LKLISEQIDKAITTRIDDQYHRGEGFYETVVNLDGSCRNIRHKPTAEMAAPELDVLHNRIKQTIAELETA